MTEMEQLEKEDTIVSLAMFIRAYGAHDLCVRLKQSYPEQFHMLMAAGMRMPKQPIARLMQNYGTPEK